MAGLQLFIDTNIFLNLYEYSTDGIEEIEKLIQHVTNEEVFLHVPEHLLNELERNRESKLKNAAMEFQKAAFPEKVPRHMLGTQGAKDYADAVRKAKEARKLLVGTANAHALQKKLNVDLKYEELFEKVTSHPENDETFQRAMARMHKGNPPGKSGSVGDQYNWETLLVALPDEDLHIVSADGDFVSPLSEQDNEVLRPLAFLEREWSQHKGGAKLLVYKTIKQFLDHFSKVRQQEEEAAAAAAEVLAIAGAAQGQEPAAQHSVNEPALATESTDEGSAGAEEASTPVEAKPSVPAFGPTATEQFVEPELSAEEQALKAAAIDRLVGSSTFQTTHEAIRDMQPFQSRLTTQEAQRLLQAANDNSQIRWIISDSDVYSFFMDVFTDHYSHISEGTVDETIDLLGLAPDPEDAEIH